MRMTNCLFVVISFIVVLEVGKPGQSQDAGSTSTVTVSVPELTEAGRTLIQFLDGMDVEHHWMRTNERVRWATGDYFTKRDGELYPPLVKDETHCSAFVAAAATRLGIYLLHPPEHSHVLLANAQYDWLNSPAGQAAGWSELSGPRVAQQHANLGELVVASYQNVDANLPGHIAVVRPSEKRFELIDEEGPQVVQAGFQNSSSISLKAGFQRHPGAWPPKDFGVRFYAHSIDAIQLMAAVKRDV